MSKTSFKDIINSEKPVLIDFYADWCGPCKAMSPIIGDLKAKMGESARILKIDVDKNQELSQKLGIQSIPTVMIFQNGDLKWRAMGVQSLAVMKTELDKLLVTE